MIKTDEHTTCPYTLRAKINELQEMVKSITGGLDEAIETNHYLEGKLELAVSDIESLCVDYYKNADDYDVMADMCNQYCIHGKEKGCFQADPSIPSRCIKFQWKGFKDE